MKNTRNLTFQGRIAVVTSDITTSEDDFHSADLLVAKYGADKIIHPNWSADITTRKEQMIDTVAALAADSEIKALIFNQALLGTNAAVDKLKETRDDVFIVYCSAHDPISEASVRASLMLRPDELGMGQAMVHQAKKQGAGVFVHYSFPRHMSQMIISSRRSLIEETCAKESLGFIDATALDHQGEAGIDGARQFILENVPRIVAEYGENTAFFCTNCNLQSSLIRAVVDNHAIYPQPCCPSPYHGFPQALGIITGEDFSNLSYLIGEISRIAEEKNMTDRLSSWPVSSSMMYANAGAEYAIKRIRGQAPKDGIDDSILMDCMSTYVKEVVGEESNVYMKPYLEEGITYKNFKLILMSYLDF